MTAILAARAEDELNGSYHPSARGVALYQQVSDAVAVHAAHASKTRAARDIVKNAARLAQMGRGGGAPRARAA